MDSCVSRHEEGEANGVIEALRAGTIGANIKETIGMSDALLYEKDGAVVLLTINRPDERNLLGRIGDGALFEKAAARIQADTSVRCAILTGAGSAFSSGGDVKAMRDRSGAFEGGSAELRESYRNEIHRMVRALWNLDVPLIAAVNGPAIGLGNDVACLADVRLASEKALFGQTFLKLGLIPGDGGAWILQQLIGYSRAAQLLLTGQLINAETASGLGAGQRSHLPGRAAAQGPRTRRRNCAAAARGAAHGQATAARRPAGSVRVGHGNVREPAGNTAAHQRPRRGGGGVLRKAPAPSSRGNRPGSGARYEIDA